MKDLYFALILMLCIIFCTEPVFSQNVTKRSYEQARAVLEKAAAAYGGTENLRALRNFTLKIKGEMVLRNQSRRPFELARAPFQLEVTVDVKNNRFREFQEGSFAGGSTYREGFVVENTDGVIFDLIRNTSTQRSNVPPAALRDHARRLPQFLILSVFERVSTIRFLGRADFDERSHAIVSYTDEEGREITLYFDEKTNLLSKFETLGTDALAGDVVSETIFTGYRIENGQRIPTGRTTKTNDELTEALSYERVSFNTDLTDAQFRVPASLRAVTYPAPSPLTKLGENIYTISTNGYNHLFVDFKDYIFVMEAPGGDAGSRKVMEQIKKIIPNKPIRFLVLTHHHDDHAEGFRTYVAEGATLVVAPGEKSFFEQAAKSRFTISPDTLMRNPKGLKIETVENGQRVFTDGTTTLEIYEIGSNPHTEAMLVAYLPKEKILFEADLLNRPPNGDRPIATDGTAYLEQWIITKKLAVEKILPVHGTMTTKDELRRAVADKEQRN